MTSPEVLYDGIAFIAEAFHDMRAKLVGSLTEADLVYALPNNPTLGEQLADFLGIEAFYAQSFASLEQDWKAYQRPAALQTPADYLTAFDGSFAKLKTALSAYRPDQGQAVTVKRGDWEPTLVQQFDTYAQAVLIVFGKLDIYIKALGKPLPERWADWVG
ncbi:MAG: hypothetical protein MUC99_12530 [Anaerolineae bacterium]|jgi:hypothetical protein|nr:hypothetical protein [Anaerolineae bacterium]